MSNVLIRLVCFAVFLLSLFNFCLLYLTVYFLHHKAVYDSVTDRSDTRIGNENVPKIIINNTIN